MYTSPSVSVQENRRKSKKIRLLRIYIDISNIYHRIDGKDYDRILNVVAV